MSEHDDCETTGEDHQRVWPKYVRVLAVCYVLSYVLQPVAFLGLTGTVVLLYYLGHPVDGLLLGVGAGAIIVVPLCSAFRRWFVAWGRRNYPKGKLE
jgi:nitric oxide reductase large subunit